MDRAVNHFDVHCGNCLQVIVPCDKMRTLADGLVVPHVDNIVLFNADFICPTCGSMVYFRLNEQRLKRLFSSIPRV
jgi:predicted RNA-binding Zn-ribbon protein involved in translation (DUF1610 family)